MKENRKYRSRKWLGSPWIVTIASTMIGVIAGLLITDYWQGRKAHKDKSVALASIYQEIEDNKRFAIQFRDTLMYQLEPFAAVVRVKKGDELRIHKDSLDAFKERTSPVLSIRATEVAANDSLIVRGKLELKFDMESMLLFTGFRDIVWSAFRAGQHINITDFSCLISLEDLYSFQHECSTALSNFMTDLVGFLRTMPREDDLEAFIADGHVLEMRLGILVQIQDDWLQNACK